MTSDSGSVFTPGTRVRLRSALDNVPAGTPGTVVGIEPVPWVPWPITVDFGGSLSNCPCAESELEPLS